MKAKTRPLLLSLCLLLVLAACGVGEAAYYEDEASPMEFKEAPKSARRESGGALDQSSPQPSAVSEPADRDDSLENEASLPGQTPEKPQERKRIYSGACRLVVDDLEDKKKTIANIAETNGGYVERVYEQTIVIRVPAERFHELFDRVLALGEHLYKAIETYDVTDFFRDQEVRLDIATKTRARLYTLLEKTTDVEERLAILREIKRLTEEIERIKRSLELLERQIALSRIVVELIPRLPQEQSTRGEIPFSWIAYLDPLYATLGNLDVKITLELGDDFALFEKEKSLRAESAEGSRLRMGSTANEPRGDADFWQKALEHHLTPYYKTVEPMDLGSFQAVLFKSKDREPFYYLVGVMVTEDEKSLTVVEVFFPNTAAREERLDQIGAALKQSRIK